MARPSVAMFASSGAASGGAASRQRRRAGVWFATGEHECPVVDRGALVVGDAIEGPALVEQMDTTTVVPPGTCATVDESMNLRIRRC